MGDFLSGLGTILAGFNDKRRIDSEGFDWKDRQAQEDWRRQRERELAAQQDFDAGLRTEDLLTKQLADVAEGDPNANLDSMIPQQYDQARRRFMVGRAKGLQAQNKRQMALLTGGQRMDELAAKLESQRAVLENTQEFQRAMQEERLAAQKEGREANAENAMKRVIAQQSGADRRARMGTVRPIVDDQGRVSGLYNTRPGENGQVQTLDAPPEMLGKRTSPPPASLTEAINQGASDEGIIDLVKNTMKDEWLGPVAYAKYQMQAKIPGMPAPDSNQAASYAAAARLRNAGIKAMTGAQMSEHEVPRLSLELPMPNDKPEVFWPKVMLLEARVQVLNQVRDGKIDKATAIRLINSMGGDQPAAPPSRSGGGGRMVKYKGKLVPLSSLPPQLQALVR